MDEYLFLWAQWGILSADQYRKTVAFFGDLKTAWEKVNQSFLLQLGFRQDKVSRILDFRDRLDFEGMVRQMEDLGIRILCVDDTEYPASLKEIHSPPPFLFVRGRMPPLHKALGVVGTRGISEYGRMATVRLVSGLAQSGFCIVSGLALGVDACAHVATLREKAPTIAVLGSGVDRFFPSENHFLGEKILEQGGAIVSEYPLGTPALSHHFPERNRIISGLSRGVLVVEGGLKSGALITARYALEQGREVFAVPSPIHRENSGTNHLIRRGEAKLVEKAEDILDEFGLESSSRQIALDFSPTETEILDRLRNDGKSMDELVLETPYNVSRLSEILVGLQLKGAAREIGGKWMIV